MVNVKTIKTVLFLTIFCILTVEISHILTSDTGYNYQQSAGFFEEPENSLDAVYIGASPTFTSWVAPLAWKKYGIAMRTLANDSQPFVAAKSLLKFARKQQPDAVYMIAINGLYAENELPIEAMHRTTDFLPQSMKRWHLINKMCDDFQYTWVEELELFFPFLRYHSRWNSLSADYFHRKPEYIKGGFVWPSFFEQVMDISDNLFETTVCKPLPNFTQAALNELLDYCKDEKVRVVFVLSAQYRDERTVMWYNTIIDEINAYGFPLINEISDFDKIGLNAKTDFYNANHTNIHGALKITDYLAQYLLDNYAFPEKTGGGYESWDKAYEEYSEIIRPYLTEEELDWVR